MERPGRKKVKLDARRSSVSREGAGRRGASEKPVFQKIKFRLARDIIPTLVMLLTAGSVTLVAAKLIAETKAAHAEPARQVVAQKSAGAVF